MQGAPLEGRQVQEGGFVLFLDAGQVRLGIVQLPHDFLQHHFPSAWPPSRLQRIANSTPLPNDHWRNRLSTKIAITRVPANGSGVPSRGVYPGRAPSPAAEQLDGHLERHHSGTARTREGGDGATCSSPLMSRDNSFFSSVKPLPKLVKSCSTSFSACTVPPHTLSQSLAALSAHPRR